MHTYIYACIHVCMHAHTHAYMYMDTCSHIHAYTHNTHIWMSIYID